MSHEQFDENCKGCQPVLLDGKTGAILANDNPMMQRVLEIWATLTLDERKTFHRVCCLNSTDPHDFRVLVKIHEKLAAAVEPDNTSN